MNKILKLALTDFKLIFRDPSLRVFLALPIILFALIVWAVPVLIERYDFLVPYLPLMLVVAVIENTQMFSFISSMVLIEEKETEVSRAYGVVPLNDWEYLISRLLFPYLFTVALNVILFWVQPFYEIGIGINLTLSFLTGLIVPLYVLGINAIVENRLQGMVYIKAFNMLVLMPVAAFFVPENLKHLFGIFPTHWVFQSVNNVTQGTPITLFVCIGLLLFGGLIWYVSRIFVRKHFA